MEFVRVSSLLIATYLVAPAVLASDWGMSMPAALEQAAKEDKMVLADFTGSDWCGPCRALRREVLDTDAFQQYAADKFVLLDVDMPKRKKLPEGVLEANMALKDAYKVGLFPTVLVLNKDGVVLGGFSGGRLNMDPVKIDLDSACSRKAAVDACMARAAALTGKEKAQALIEAYMLIPQSLQHFNAPLLAQIAAADPQDELGFTAKLAAAKEARTQEVLKEQELGQRINAIPLNKRVDAIDAMLADPKTKAGDKARLKWTRLNTLFLLCETPADLERVKAEMTTFANSLDAAGKEKTHSIIRAIFASEPSELLERIRNMRGNNPS